MSNISMRKITPNCWIASTQGSPTALIHRSDDHYLFMTPETSQKFANMAAIKTYLGGRVKEQITEASSGLNSEAKDNIEGYPVKHATMSVECGGDRPVYVRGKQTKHVAGYWCIKFSKRWVPSFCPLLKTIEQYQSAGPFKTRLDMMNNMSALNRQNG